MRERRRNPFRDTIYLIRCIRMVYENMSLEELEEEQ